MILSILQRAIDAFVLIYSPLFFLYSVSILIIMKFLQNDEARLIWKHCCRRLFAICFSFCQKKTQLRIMFIYSQVIQSIQTRCAPRLTFLRFFPHCDILSCLIVSNSVLQKSATFSFSLSMTSLYERIKTRQYMFAAAKIAVG